jgi:maltose alpha-D-glucosyltransferase/alpha-amylase
VLADEPFPAEQQEAIGTYVEVAHLLGVRTAELHLTLASELNDPLFAPEQFTLPYQRSASERMNNIADQVLARLERQLPAIAAETQREARWVLELKDAIFEKYRLTVDHRISAQRTRIHGDFHLGEVLCTGKDFVIVDFEGDPREAPTQRMIKRSPLRDVVSMLQSFNAAAYSALLAQLKTGVIRDEDIPNFEGWARYWIRCVSALYLKAYLDTATTGTFLPTSKADLRTLFDAYALDKAMRDLGRDLDAGTNQLAIALRGILRFLPPNSASRSADF